LDHSRENEVQGKKMPMRTDWHTRFTDDDNGSTSDPIPRPTSQDEVDEFTDSGVLIPYKEFLNYDGFELARSLGDETEDQVAAEIFRRDSSDYTLIHLAVLGVPAWIVCRTRSAYLRFVRDWLRPLVELNRADAFRDAQEPAEDQRRAF